ncbi:MAG: hypothetical protein V4490_07180 [Pseudomonadota bacterium]
MLRSGWTRKQVSEALLLDEDTLLSYVSKYLSSGIDALIGSHYLGSLFRLHEAQQTALREECDEKYCKLTGGLK